MKGQPTDFWGKLSKDKDGIVTDWHPLIDHCADVAACTMVLLEQPVIRRRIAACGGMEDLETIQQTRLCVLAALHDIGKFNVGFQNKALIKPAFIEGHVSQTVWLFDCDCNEQRSLFGAIGLPEMTGWADDDSACRLLIAALCHHGRPVSCRGGNANPALWRPYRNLDPIEGTGRLMNLTKSRFPVAYVNEGCPRLPALPQLQHAFSGLVMLADWLASDEDFFPFSNEGDPDRFIFSCERARQICDRLFLNPRPAIDALGPELITFSGVFGPQFTPRGVQIAIESLEMPLNGSITIIEAETGSGKTEAAFRYFLRLFHARKVDGMYFALPTRTAATQIHARILQYIRSTFGGNAPPVILAVPGYLRTDDTTGLRLAPFEVLWNDDDKERFRYRGWAAEHPKRYLAGCIIVGTVDQVLFSSLTVSHAHLRATAYRLRTTPVFQRKTA
ncbi:MAG: CRISPR-associated endonuclease Cas3'' [Chitinispirillaceae bacterium]|nr:CRISPR-associated endonuclease Cas3'' [Chitinispirillaceae bacterium]